MQSNKILSWCAFALVLLLLGALSTPCAAARWLDIGNSNSSLDKIYIDADSVQQVDGYRIISIMTVYQAPRENKNGITMDRHIQKTAFDCESKMFFGIQIIGYLDGKKVGNSPEATDWKTKLVSVRNDPLSQRALLAACKLPIAGGSNPGSLSPSSGVGPQKVKLSSGSGILLNDAGFVLTDAHVINGCKALVVKPVGIDALPGKVEAVDIKNDLAIIKTSGGYGQFAQFRAQSEPAKLGESVGVIGYPLAGILSTEPKATFGQVSSVAGINNDYTLLQISAPIQPGNSGGPVLDSSGNVMGIVVSEISPALASKIGVVPQNINFAIRGELAQIFMQAHGIKFSTSQNHHKKLPTEAIAAAGQNSTVLVLCAHE